LQYYVGEKFVYVFLFSEQQAHFYRLGTTELLKKNMLLFKDKLLQRHGADEILKNISKTLIPFHKDLNKKCIIIPHTLLNDIPFELLTTTNGTKLVTKIDISYDAALSLINNNQKNYTDYKTNWVGFGVSKAGDNALPQVINEIENISKLLKDPKYIRKEATKKRMLKEFKSSKIVHIASHGILDKKNALYNKLILNDKDLTTSEIYNEKIHSKMIVLSACNTGNGIQQTGEGIISLARAFRFGGAKSVIMSLWEVPDQQTSEIMLFFYKHLKNGIPKDKALRLAKLEYLNSVEDIKFKAPFYWAGFIINGNTTPIDFNNHQYSYWWLLIPILIFFIILYFKKIYYKI